MVDIRFEGLDKVNKELKKISKKAKNLRPFFRDSELLIFRDVQDHFRKEQNSNGTRWKRRKKTTDLNYDANPSSKFRSSNKVLSLNDDLRKVIRFHDNKSAGVGSRLKYSKLHNDGGRVASKTIKPKKGKTLSWIGADGIRRFSKGHRVKGFKMPKREFMWLSNKAGKKILDLIERHLTR